MQTLIEVVRFIVVKSDRLLGWLLIGERRSVLNHRRYQFKGILGAKELGSDFLVKEARKAYPILVAAWLREDAIKKLRRHL